MLESLLREVDFDGAPFPRRLSAERATILVGPEGGEPEISVNDLETRLKLGQDVLYAALKSIRISLVIGTLTTLVLLPLGMENGAPLGDKLENVKFFFEMKTT